MLRQDILMPSAIQPLLLALYMYVMGKVASNMFRKVFKKALKVPLMSSFK
jgi:hypothetical protein